MTAETNLKSLKDPTVQESPSSLNSATLIDNETLRDQVQHLQRKSAKLEEQLEETRATLERDVFTYQEKISRMRLEEEQHKRELTFKTREVEQVIQSESSLRNRIEEIEEAFRESAVALEIARAEVEALRTEMAVSGFGFSRAVFNSQFFRTLTFCWTMMHLKLICPLNLLTSPRKLPPTSPSTWRKSAN